MTPDELAQKAERILRAHALDDGDVAALVRVLASCRELKLATGQTLCAQGDAADALYFLLDGRMRVSKRDDAGADREVGTWFAPAIIEAPSVVAGTVRATTCVAGAPSQLAVLDLAAAKDKLREPTAEGSVLRWVLLSNLTEMLGSVTAHLRAALADGKTEPTLTAAHAAFARVDPSAP